MAHGIRSPSGTGSSGGSPVAGATAPEVVVPLLAAEEPVLTDQVRVGAALARARGVPLRVVAPGSVGAASQRRSEVTSGAETTLLAWALERRNRAPAGLGGGLLPGTGGLRVDGEVDTLVLPGDADAGVVRRRLLDRVALRAECDVVTVNGRHGYDRPPSMLLAVAGGPHSGIATEVARRVAADCDAWIDVLHVLPPDAPWSRRERAREVVNAACRRIDRPATTSPWLLEAEDVADTIVEQSRYYELTVVGAPTKGRLRRLVFGSTERSVAANARSVVLSARAGE